MNPEQLIAELNLDETAETIQVLNSLIEVSKTMIMKAVNSKLPIETYADDLIFQRAVSTLATQMYYDRALSGGYGLGLKMMIESLQGGYVNVSSSPS